MDDVLDVRTDVNDCVGAKASTPPYDTLLAAITRNVVTDSDGNLIFFVLSFLQ